jgi:hypothetical protein
MAGMTLLRPERKDLDALAAGANALLERLPRPDAALLVGLALREPPKWNVSLARPKLAPIADKDALRVAAPVRSVVVDAIPRPAPHGLETLKTPAFDLGAVADVGAQVRATAPAGAVLPTKPRRQCASGASIRRRSPATRMHVSASRSCSPGRATCGTVPSRPTARNSTACAAPARWSADTCRKRKSRCR